MRARLLLPPEHTAKLTGPPSPRYHITLYHQCHSAIWIRQGKCVSLLSQNTRQTQCTPQSPNRQKMSLVRPGSARCPCQRAPAQPGYTRSHATEPRPSMHPCVLARALEACQLCLIVNYRSHHQIRAPKRALSPLAVCKRVACERATTPPGSRPVVVKCIEQLLRSSNESTTQCQPGPNTCHHFTGRTFLITVLSRPD